MTAPRLKSENLVAVATTTEQTGFESSHAFRHILPITDSTTIGELVQWVNAKKHILSLVSLEIQNTEKP